MKSHLYIHSPNIYTVLCAFKMPLVMMSAGTMAKERARTNAKTRGQAQIGSKGIESE